MNYAGRHVILDALLPEMLGPEALLSACEEAIAISGMTVICRVQKDFKPQGLTAVWVLSESHFSLHTYPEHRYISADCYTCGDEGDPSRAMDELVRLLRPVEAHRRDMPRGHIGAGGGDVSYKPR